MSIWKLYTSRIMRICNVDESTAKEILDAMEHTAFNFSEFTHREFAQEAKFIQQDLLCV